MASDTDSRELIDLLTGSAWALGASIIDTDYAIYSEQKGSNTDSRATIGLLRLIVDLLESGGGGGGGGEVRISRQPNNSISKKTDGLYAKKFLISSRDGNTLIEEVDGYFVPESEEKLAENIISNIQVGATKSGSYFNKGLTFTDFAKKILENDTPIMEFTTITPKTQEIGNSTGPISFNYEIIRPLGVNSKVKFQELNLYVNNTLITTRTIDPTLANVSGSFDYIPGVSVTSQFKCVLDYENFDGTSDKVEEVIDIIFAYPSYYGATFSVPSVITETEIKGLRKAIVGVKDYKQEVPTLSNQRIVYAYPKYYGSLTNIKDSNGFNVIDSFERREVVVNSLTYYLYVLKDPITETGIEIVYK